MDAGRGGRPENPQIADACTFGIDPFFRSLHNAALKFAGTSTESHLLDLSDPRLESGRGVAGEEGIPGSGSRGVRMSRGRADSRSSSRRRLTVMRRCPTPMAVLGA